MAIDFPTSPSVGQAYVYGGVTYTYTAEGIWVGVTDLVAPFTTGDAKLTFKIVADVGWVLANDGSLGNAASGATTRANADTSPLFELLYANIDDTGAPIQTSAGAATTRAAQGTAAAAYAAGCRLVLPRQLGRALAIAGSGAGLSTYLLGAYDGAETQAQTDVMQHAHTMAHTHDMTGGSGYPALLTNTGTGAQSGSGIYQANAYTYNTGQPSNGSTSNAGASTPIPIKPPRAYWNVLVKL